MKKIALLFLVVVLAFGLAGCPKKDKDADPVGTWTMVLDEACNGADVAWVFHIYDNGTFLIDSVATGIWNVNNDDITMNVAAGVYILNGSVDGAGMTGTFSGSGVTGCWTGSRTSTTP